MRIVAGEARGRTLIAPKGLETRPTADKIREALFSILMHETPGARVLDLFGGTGALALEAVSRGAQSAVICDISQEAVRAIEKNVLTVTRGEGDVRVIKADYRRALETLRGSRFSLVFLDPPYRMHEAYTNAVRFILGEDMLSEDGLIIAEHEKNADIVWPEAAEMKNSRIYRDTQLDFLVRRVL